MKVIRQPKYYTLYLHRNLSNGKCYVGQTSQPILKRWQDGKGYKGCTAFNGAIEKYGWDGFEHIVLRDHILKSKVDLWERYYIKKYNSLVPDGYNLQTGGNANKSISEETRQRLRESHKGQKPTEKSLNNLRAMAEARRGVPLPEETRRKVAEANRRKSHRKGFHLSEEHKRKIGEANKGHIPATYGKHLSQTTKDKISQARKGVYINFNYDEMQSINEMYWEQGMSLRSIEKQQPHGVHYLSKVVNDPQFVTPNKTKFKNGEFMQVNDVAQMIGVNPHTLYRYMKGAGIKTIAFNRRAYLTQDGYRRLKEMHDENYKKRANISC